MKYYENLRKTALRVFTEKRISYAELANEMQVDSHNLNNILNGKKPASVSMIIKILEVLGCNIDIIVTEPINRQIADKLALLSEKELSDFYAIVEKQKGSEIANNYINSVVQPLYRGRNKFALYFKDTQQELVYSMPTQKGSL